MENNNSKLSNNALSVMALASEYCRIIELAASTEPSVFVDKVIRLLPRIYMAVTDLPKDDYISNNDYLYGTSHIEESYYNQVMQNIATLLGENDSYLETFHQDMKYSDTPIAATISESLADIFQVLFNFIEDVRNADIDDINEHLSNLRSDFADYWSQIVCNVMRPLNEIVMSQSDIDYDKNSDEMDFV